MRVGLFPRVEGPDGADNVDLVVGGNSLVLDGVLGLQRSFVGHCYHAVALFSGHDHRVVSAPDSLVWTHALGAVTLNKVGN